MTHLSQNLVLRDNSVDRQHERTRAIVAQKSISIVEKPASTQAQPPRLDGIVLGQGPSVNEEFSSAQLHLREGFRRNKRVQRHRGTPGHVSDVRLSHRPKLVTDPAGDHRQQDQQGIVLCPHRPGFGANVGVFM